MPQLSIETFVSQYFWLTLLLLIFYVQMVNWVIPKIAQISKIRRELGETSTTTTGADSLDLGSKKLGFSVSPIVLDNSKTTELVNLKKDWCQKTK